MTILLRFAAALCSLVLIGCATTEVQSKREARFHLSEKVRTGLISKDQYPAELQKVSALDLPEEPSKPFNSARITKECEREAKGSLSAPVTRDYNTGAISQEAYRQRMGLMLQAMIAANNQRASYNYTPSPSYAPSFAGNRHDPNSLANPYGAGSPYKADGLMNPYSQYGSRYSNKSWTNPYATNPPKLYDSNGKYLGRFSSNKYDPDSISNPYGKYGNKYSPDSINNRYGAGNPYNTSPIYVVPQN